AAAWDSSDSLTPAAGWPSGQRTGPATVIVSGGEPGARATGGSAGASAPAAAAAPRPAATSRPAHWSLRVVMTGEAPRARAAAAADGRPAVARRAACTRAGGKPLAAGELPTAASSPAHTAPP